MASEVGAAAGAAHPVVALRVVLALARANTGRAAVHVVTHLALAVVVRRQLELQDGETEGDLQRQEGTKTGGLAAAGGAVGTVGAGLDGGVDGVGHRVFSSGVAEEWRKAPPEPFRVHL